MKKLSLSLNVRSPSIPAIPKPISSCPLPLILPAEVSKVLILQKEPSGLIPVAFGDMHLHAGWVISLMENLKTL